MKQNDPNFDKTKVLPLSKQIPEDPYERGFADKLYEDYEDDFSKNFDIDVDFDSQEPDEPRESREQWDSYYEPPERQRKRARPDPLAPQVWTPGKQKRPPVGEPSRANSQPVRASRAEQYSAERRPKAAPASKSYGEERPPKKRKKRRSFFGILIRILGLLLALLLIFLLVLHVMAKPPMGTGLGAHKEDSATILLAGTDESGDRTDTLMLLNINKTTGQISLMSIPRDTKINCTYWPQKINAAYGMNGKGEEGMDSLMDYVKECVGFRPDGYVLVELDVFIDLVNLFGGVEFNVPMDMYYDDPTQDLHIALNSGLQTLDGEEAMGLVRYRYGYYDADIGRVRVQRDFMLAALNQWVSLKNAWKAPAALALLKSNAMTDLSMENFTWFAEAVLSCGTENMYMTTIPFSISGDGLYVLISADGDYLNLINTYFNPYENDVTWDDLEIAY